jgi:hypothetical protein
MPYITRRESNQPKAKEDKMATRGKKATAWFKVIPHAVESGLRNATQQTVMASTGEHGTLVFFIKGTEYPHPQQFRSGLEASRSAWRIAKQAGYAGVQVYDYTRGCMRDVMSDVGPTLH